MRIDENSATIMAVLVVWLLIIGSTLPLAGNFTDNDIGADTVQDEHGAPAQELDLSSSATTSAPGNPATRATQATQATQATHGARGARDPFTESESNDDFTHSDDISAISEPITVYGGLYTPADVDIYKIWLDGNGKPIENLTVKVKYLNSEDWQTRYYSTFFVSIWGQFEKEYPLMKVVSCRVYDWHDEEDCPPASIHTFSTGYYYIKASAYRTSTWADDQIDYTLEVTSNPLEPEDDNQVLEFADGIIGPISNKKVTMATDIFDWYYFDPPNPDDFQGEYTKINFSITVDITNSKVMQSEHINNVMIYFVTEVYVLVYRENSSGVYKGDVVIGNRNNKYDQENPIMLHQWAAFDSRTYIGIYVQTIGKTNEGQGEYLWGDGYCDGWAEYSIKKIQAKPIISPILSNSKVDDPIGKVYHTYTYSVKYSDENNDKPIKITITIDSGTGQIGPEPMTKTDVDDKDYTDGCIYQFVIDGNEFDPSREEHEYQIWAEDVETKVRTPLKGWGPIITENILPAARPSAPSTYILYEDDPISYLDLNLTFEDPDNDTLYYRLSNNNEDWSTIFHSENISIKVVKLEDDEGNKNQFLEFRPKENMFNRHPGQKYGSEIVYINVSDDNPANPKYPNNENNITRAHYMWNPFELKLIMIGVNDAPQIRSSFSYHFMHGVLELQEDQIYRAFDLNDIFWDPIENDPLTFLVRNNNNIDIRFYSNGTIDITPKENWTGTESLEFIADDGQATVEDNLKIKVLPVNDDPYLNYTPKQVIFEDEWWNITFIGHDHADNEPVYFETNLMLVLDLSEDEYEFNPDTGELGFVPDDDHVGTFKNIWVKVKDYNGGETTQIIIFEIKNSPDPPEPIIKQPGDDDRFLDSEIIDFQGDYYDPDDEILVEEHSYKWYSNIDGNLSSTKNFRTSLSIGEHVITFYVADPVHETPVSITITIVAKADDDSDEDGIPDYWETLHSLNKINPYDADEDPDGDDFTNLEEYLGMDGKAGGLDDTDPWDAEQHPEKHFKKSVEKDDTIYYTGIILVIIIIVILIVFFVVQIYRRNMKAKAEAEQAKAEEQKREIWQDMFGRNYEVYTYKPNYIVCNNCLEQLEIQLPVRPLVVTCPKCKKRGVLY